MGLCWDPDLPGEIRVEKSALKTCFLVSALFFFFIITATMYGVLENFKTMEIRISI